MGIRVTQTAVEALSQPDTQKLRVTHTADEILLIPSVRAVRVTHAVVETLVKADEPTTVSNSFSSNAVLKATLTSTASADAVIQTGNVIGFTSDAILLRSINTTFSADALLTNVVTDTFTADSILAGATGGALFADAVLLETVPITVSADSVILKTLYVTFDADAVLISPSSVTFTADSIIKTTVSPTFTANATLKVELSHTFSADAVLSPVAGGPSAFTADSILKRTVSATFTANASFFKTIDRNIFADSVLVQNPPFTANAVLKKTVIVARTASAVLKATVGPKTLTSEAILGDTPVAPVLIFEDDFNRTTTAPDVGQPSGGGQITKFDEFPEPGLQFVNGSELVVPVNGIDGDSEYWFRFGPTAPEADIMFDFYTSPYGYYEYSGPGGYNPAEPTAFKYFMPEFSIFDDDGTGIAWTLQTGNSFDIPLGLSDATWYRVRARIIGRDVSVRVWDRSLPEPSTWAIENQPALNRNGLPFFANSSLLYVGWWDLPSGEHRVDNLQVYRRGVETHNYFRADALLGGFVSRTFSADAIIAGIPGDDFTADSEIVAFAGTYQWGFTASAEIVPDTHIHSFTSNAYLVATSTRTFTANAKISILNLRTFTANAWLRTAPTKTFTANAYIFRASDVTPSFSGGFRTLRKTTQLHVGDRRERPLDAFVPPRNPTESEITPPTTGGQPPCLPPCSGVGSGGNAMYGMTGFAVRETLAWCSNCNVYFHSDRNQLGRDTGASSINFAHSGCEVAHTGASHLYRIWVEYAQLPTSPFAMRVKLQWDGSAPGVAHIRVFSNVLRPQVATHVAYSTSYESETWNGGRFVGTLDFKGILDSATNRWYCNTPSNLILEPSAMTTTTFRFEMDDEVTFYKSEFKATNLELPL